MRNLALRALAVCTLCVFIAATGSVFAAAGTHKIAGTWELAGQPDENDCPVPPPPFVNFSTISSDGTMINLDPTEGTSAGRVRFVPGGGYTAHFFGYIGTTGLQFEVLGWLSLEDSDSLAGTYTVYLSAPDGSPICNWDGTITATRLD